MGIIRGTRAESQHSKSLLQFQAILTPWEVLLQSQSQVALVLLRFSYYDGPDFDLKALYIICKHTLCRNVCILHDIWIISIYEDIIKVVPTERIWTKWEYFWEYEMKNEICY